MKKAITLILLASMLAASIASTVACGGGSGSNDTTASGGETTAAPETSPDNIPLGTDLGGATVKIYTRGDTNVTEWDAEQTGDIVDDAIYARNNAIEERLHVNLEFFCNTSDDFWGDRNIYMDTVRASVLANDGSVDIAAGLSNIMPELAQDGMFYNFLDSDMPYLDFDSDWWPKSLVDELSVDGRMYMASGEVNLGVIKGVMCFYFNKNLIDEYKLESPYDLVNDGKWTLDKFNEMAQVAYKDLNGDSAVDKDDQFGFIISNENHAPNFVLASGLRLTARDDDGMPYYSLGEERTVDIITKMQQFMTQDGFVLKLDGVNDYANTFVEGRALFRTGEFQYAANMREMTFDFGVIPYPKAEESQTDYITSSRATYSLVGICVTANKENCAAVLEAIASENHRNVTPAYFEKALKVKYSRDDISSQMFDLIRSHISFDWGVVHGPSMNNISTLLRQTVSNKKTDAWTTTWASQESATNAAVEAYLEKILALEN